MRLHDLEFIEIPFKYFDSTYEAKIEIRQGLFLIITYYSKPFLKANIFITNKNNNKQEVIMNDAEEYDINRLLSVFID